MQLTTGQLLVSFQEMPSINSSALFLRPSWGVLEKGSSIYHQPLKVLASKESSVPTRETPRGMLSRNLKPLVFVTVDHWPLHDFRGRSQVR